MVPLCHQLVTIATQMLLSLWAHVNPIEVHLLGHSRNHILLVAVPLTARATAFVVSLAIVETHH